ncbi:Citreoviridin biosynthesis protein D [Fusarium oxysporum f. sp. cubense]|uniref:Citreoviridin biosynthesis protein D n=1 Tax=Fusarium oxysporum f. sp. cubense TaxID=61366 RepID=A0A559KWX1_FUSOC|nr:Citreoviridin biosynthesis protein D [Fusarium oxysporum f. sp. cubense]
MTASSLSSRTPTLILLSILTIFGFDALILQLDRNGYTSMLKSITHDPLPRFLPDTNRLLLKQYTGIGPVDDFFAFSNVIWANVTDGSRPELSLFTFCFGAQLIAVFVVFLIEAQRVLAWSPVVLNGVFWEFAVQSLGFGFVAPLYFVIHLIFTAGSPRSESVHLRDYLCLHTVVPSFMLGYIVPCIFMAYPFSNFNVRQWANAVWAIAPVYIFTLQAAFTVVLKRLSVGQDAHKPKVVLDKIALSHAYSFAWNVAVIGQMTTYAVLTTASLLPSIFPSGIAESLSMNRVFIPDAAPHSYKPMSSAAAAMHNFLIYDFATGSVAALVWALQQLLEVKPELRAGEERTNLVRGVVTSVLLSGPGGAVVALMQHRDESVLSAEGKAEKIQ